MDYEDEENWQLQRVPPDVGDGQTVLMVTAAVHIRP